MERTSSRLEDPDRAIGVIRERTPARSHSKAFVIVIRRPGHISVQMNGVNARRESVQYIVTLVKKGDKWVAMVSQGDNDPDESPGARNPVQAANLAARMVTKRYMGEGKDDQESLRCRVYMEEGWTERARGHVADWILTDEKLKSMLDELSKKGNPPGVIALKLMTAMSKMPHAKSGKTPFRFGAVSLSKRRVENAVKSILKIPIEPRSDRAKETDLAPQRRLARLRSRKYMDEASPGDVLFGRIRAGMKVRFEGRAHSSRLPEFMVSTVAKAMNLITGKDVKDGVMVYMRYSPQSGSFFVSKSDRNSIASGGRTETGGIEVLPSMIILSK